MSPHRSHGRGSLVLDRELGDRIGRIRLASGTSDVTVFRRMNDMLTSLKETARWDLLRALRDHVFPPLELWAAYRDSRLDTLPTSQELQPAKAAIDRWLPRLDATPKHRKRYEQVTAKLLVGHTEARVTDLPTVLRALRNTCQDSGQRRTYNMARSALQAFLRDAFGSGHRLWAAVADVQRLKETPRRGNPQTVDQLVALAKQLGTHRGVLWSLALTGMRRGEYWGADAVGKGTWEAKGDRILVHGTKTAGADRFIPLVLPPADPTVGYWGFAKLLRTVTKNAVNVHDLRKSYANILESASIVRTRRRLYLGHGKSDVTDLYELHQVAEFLAQDAERIRAFIGDAPAKALEVMA